MQAHSCAARCAPLATSASERVRIATFAHSFSRTLARLEKGIRVSSFRNAKANNISGGHSTGFGGASARAESLVACLVDLILFIATRFGYDMAIKKCLRARTSSDRQRLNLRLRYVEHDPSRKLRDTKQEPDTARVGEPHAWAARKHRQLVRAVACCGSLSNLSLAKTERAR